MALYYDNRRFHEHDSHRKNALSINYVTTVCILFSIERYSSNSVFPNCVPQHIRSCAANIFRIWDNNCNNIQDIACIDKHIRFKGAALIADK